MSQPSVERALGKLVTDPSFRARFFHDPVTASLCAGLTLTAPEVEALLRIPSRALADFEHSVDDRICRLAMPCADRPRGGLAQAPGAEGAR